MNLKTYQAYSMAEVLTRIRKDLGDGAVVLHTRTFSRGGILGLGARTVYEVTASDQAQGDPLPASPKAEASPRLVEAKPARSATNSIIDNESPLDPRDRGSAAEQTILEHILLQKTMRENGKRSTYGSAGRAPVTKKPPSPNPKLTRPPARNSAHELLASLSELGQHADSTIKVPDPQPKSQHQTTDWPTPPTADKSLRANTGAQSQNLEQPEASSKPERTPARSGLTKPLVVPSSVTKRFIIDPQSGCAQAAPKLAPPKSHPALAPTPATGTTPPVASAVEVKPSPAKQSRRRTKSSKAAATTTKPSPKAKSPKKKATVKRVATKKTTTKKIPAKKKTTPKKVAKRSATKKQTTAPVETNDPMRSELAALRALVTQVMEQQQQQQQNTTATASTTNSTVHEALTKQYTEMIQHEVAEELANDICGQIQAELSPSELQDEELVRAELLSQLMEHIPVVESAIVDGQRIHDDGRPLTMALVGPTGVGKTTTIAKLAASFKLRDQLTVGMITTDTYRIAAVDQLRTYADIIGVPLKVALTPAEIASACHALRDVDVILIDTAGRSPNDSERIDEIQSFINAAEPHETHLVLSSATSEQVILRTIDRFSTVQADRVIFTKLDEAVNFGVIVNVMRKVGKKLSFITTGQEVPDQIERGEAGRLARLILGESLRG